MNPTLRSACASDLDALVAIEQAVFLADRISRRAFRRLLDRDSARLIVAERETRIVGYALLLFRSSSSSARLYSIATLPGEAGHGTGGRLLDAAEAAAREAGRVAMRLEVRADNARALGWYERRGFRNIGRTLAYYADGATALRYEKTLGLPDIRHRNHAA